MLGLTEISSGTVSVLGHDPAREPLKVKRRVGYLPDSVGFYDHLTATENLAYTAKLMGFRRRSGAADCGGAGAGAAVRRRRQARRDLLARHAPASRPCRDHRQAGRDRHPRRADLGPRSAGDARIPRPDRGTQGRRRHGAAVVAPARSGAAGVRPRRAVPGRPHRADGAGCRSRPPGARRGLCGRSRGGRRRACAAARHHTRRDQCRNAGRRPFPHDRRPRRAAGRGARRRRRQRIAAPAFGRRAEPGGDLCPLLPEPEEHREERVMRREGSPSRALAPWRSRNWRTICPARACSCSNG